MESVPLAELCAIYRAADVMLVTSLRDGMNMVAKEFVSSRTDEDGVLILSEMAGASEELTDALIVNPYSVEQLAGAMSTALTLDRDERGRRMRSLRRRVAERTVESWVERFVGDLAAAASPRLPAGQQLAETIGGAARTGERVSLAFVYEDALIDRLGPAAPLSPDPELLELLRDLATRSQIDVHVISALERAVLGPWFDTVPVTIWAEDGLWKRERDKHQWRRTECGETGWTEDVRELLNQFTSRTPGAFVEERSTGLAWHFGRADPIEGRGQAQTVFALLRDAGEAMGFSVVLTPSVIELRTAGLSTGHTIKKLIEGDAGARRVIAFAGSSAGVAVRDALRASDVLVTIGASQADGDHTLTDIRAARDVLQAIAGSLPPVRHRSPDFATRLRNAAAAITGAAAPVSAPIAIRME